MISFNINYKYKKKSFTSSEKDVVFLRSSGAFYDKVEPILLVEICNSYISNVSNRIIQLLCYYYYNIYF